MKTLIVICARKGSKRLRKKHWADIAGEPMWLRAFDAADAVYGTESVFSTDDLDIIRWIERDPGSSKPKALLRPRNLARDSTPIHEVLLHALTSQSEWGRFGAVAFVPANVPTVTPEIITRCINKLARTPSLTSVITVRTARDLPEWMWVRGPEGELEPAMRQTSHAYRMQDIPKRLIATGTANVVRTETLINCRDGAAFKYLGGVIGYVMDEHAIEVHDAHDLELARAWLEKEESR